MVFFPALLPGWCLGRELLALQGTLCWEQPGLEPSGLGALRLNSSPVDLSVIPLCSVGFFWGGGSFRNIFAGSALAEGRGCISEVAANAQGQHRSSFRDRRVSCGSGSGVTSPCCVLTLLLSLPPCPFPAETRTHVADLPDDFSFPLPPQTRPQLSRSTSRTAEPPKHPRGLVVHRSRSSADAARLGLPPFGPGAFFTLPPGASVGFFYL